MSKATVSVTELADLMDDCSDQADAWNGSDICDGLAEIIDARGGWKRCPEHGSYSVAKASCPFCERGLREEIESIQRAMTVYSDDPRFSSEARAIYDTLADGLRKALEGRV